jgi:hypothetical protein
MTESKLPTDTYWVNLPNVDVGPAVAEKFKKYQDELEELGRNKLCQLMRRRYEGGGHVAGDTTSRVAHGGEQGEESRITINHLASIVTSVHSLMTQNRPAFSVAARDDSAESLASVQLTEQLLEYELQRGAEQEYTDACKRMLLFQETGLGVFWHAELGEVVAARPMLDELGQPVLDELGQQQMEPAQRKGELRTEALSPYDVARDLGARAVTDCTWQIVRRRANKWDLAALYPEHEGEIIGAPTVDRDDLASTVSTSAMKTSDTVYVLELYALRTPACPTGRYARVCGTTTLEAGELQYKRLPVGLHAPERTIDQATGTSRTIDLLGPQQAYDAVMSASLSNVEAFGKGNVIYEEGHDLDIEDIGGGLQGVQYTHKDGAPEPHAMDLPRLKTEDLRYAETLQNDMQKLKAISSIARGATDESIKSGAHGALVSASAAQHNSGDQKAAAEMLRDWANRVLETYRTFATAERLIEVSGADEIRTAKNFVGKQLESVLGVDVQIANPYMRTIAGKKELADFYADPARWADASLDMHQHMAFMSTGRIQPLFRSARSEIIAIREENESLMKGEPHMVAKSDHHEKHMAEHKAIIDGKRRRELPPNVIAAVTEAYDAHLAMWVRLTIEEPAVLAATGQRPAPLPMMAQGAPPGGPPMPGGGPPPGAPANDNGAPPVGPPNEMGEQPRMPQMPTNPATGQRVASNGGPQ